MLNDLLNELPSEDRDTLVACADLVGRTGARDFEIGYLHDNVPMEQAGWYAHARYQGTRVGVENHPGPAAAAQALAERVLTGAKCGCGRLVALSDEGAIAFNGTIVADGSRWTVEQAVAAGQCRWRRVGPRWEQGCATDGQRGGAPA
ncbi:hypothetical protein [Sphaerisporangium aureirubrum]|uniref:Uncharacterized protein n=1 Tax=Sphaerisporangium aureirubrum TaxID=1544736 RepID=A0ABW1ND63_9ACTN